MKQNKNMVLQILILLLVVVSTTIISQTSTNTFLQDQIRSSLDINPELSQKGSSSPFISSKIGAEIIDGNTTLKTDKDNYKPGDTVVIEAESRTNEMNGSLEWRLESPISEVAFDFNSQYLDIFEDPTFDDPTIPHPDWNADGFDSVESPSGYLNLTEISDADTNEDEIYFYDTSTIEYGSQNPSYVVSFDYYTQGYNLLNNSGFESGKTYWFGDTDNVTTPNDPENAWAGNQYADINATKGEYILYQNITNWTGGRTAVFSARATGNTSANYWGLKLEAFNSSGDIIGSLQSPDLSPVFPTDAKGYVTLVLEYNTPLDTVKLRATFMGFDSGPEADGFYTGRLDGCILSEKTPQLVFSYFGSTNQWDNKTLDEGQHQWKNTKFKIELGTNAPVSTKTFRFILRDPNVFTNVTTAYWYIDNVSVNFATKPSQTTGISTTRNTGIINSTWFHRGYRENLSSAFNIKAELPDATGYGDSKATIWLQLPTHQLYFGSWVLVFKIRQVDATLIPITPVKTINISFIVEDTVNFIIQDTYVLRGSTNNTIGDEFNFTEYFEQETDIEVISPRDNITILGYIEANSTPTEWYDNKYLRIGSSTTDFYVKNSSTNPFVGNISWTAFGYIPFNEEGETLIDGNFSTPLSNIKTFGINFQVPSRGFYGNLTAEFTISLEAPNSKPQGVGGTPLSIVMPLELPEIKFKINVTEEHLPANAYLKTDYLEGNISIEVLNFRDQLETEYPNRNISSKLNIPLSDLDLSIFISNQADSSGRIAQEFNYQIIGLTLTWLDMVDPHLETGLYDFQIRWNTPFRLNVENQSYLNLSSSLVINISGTLDLIPPTAFEIPQGGQITLNFSVLLTEKGKNVGGLNLKAVVSGNTSGDLIVYEENGRYFIDLDIDMDTPLGTYNVQVLLSETNTPLGDAFSFTVVSAPGQKTDDLNLTDIILSIGAFASFIILAGLFVVLMIRINKSI